MTRASKFFSVENEVSLDSISEKVFTYFNHNSKTLGNLLGVGVSDSISIPANDQTDVFERTQNFMNLHNGDWIFGYFGYDLKNNIEKLGSRHKDFLDFPKAFFFVPSIVFEINRNSVSAHFDASKTSENELSQLILKLFGDQKNIHQKSNENKNNVHARIEKNVYLNDIKKLQKHIQDGDIYEVNYCQEFFSDKISFDPIATYNKLNTITQAPFSAYFRNFHQHIICGSPERYLKKINNKIISQPIKGTAKRGSTESEDEVIVSNLLNSKKEKSENVMIVDLVRNDLSKIAEKGSVKVEELFQLHTFKNVHQMISTVTCEVNENKNITEIVKNTFPMGSMTGVPKIRAMQIIDELEHSNRGVFSGSLGYINPNGDFDFNVIIRSIVYDSEKKYASISAGSAITIASDPEMEYEESLLKAFAMIRALNGELNG